MNPILRFLGVSKSFAPHAVLSNIWADVSGQGLTFVVGRSGTGKSVLCKLAVGLLKPDAGQIELLGWPVHRTPESKLVPLRRRAPYLVQTAALLDWLTVEQNIQLANPSEALVQNAIETLDLSSLRRRRPTELGPGARKRVSIARALANDPAFVLLDEPTTGLDPTEAAQVVWALRSIKSRGLGALVVSHDYRALSDLADRILWLKEGAVAFQGPAGDFFASSDPQIRHLLNPPLVEASAYG